MLLGGCIVGGPVACDANDDSVVRTADCSRCPEELADACLDTYTTCLTDDGETSDVCQGRVDALCPEVEEDAGGDAAVIDAAGGDATPD